MRLRDMRFVYFMCAIQLSHNITGRMFVRTSFPLTLGKFLRFRIDGLPIGWVPATGIFGQAITKVQPCAYRRGVWCESQERFQDNGFTVHDDNLHFIVPAAIDSLCAKLHQLR